MPAHIKLGLLVAGGPAPGINSVISAATIRSCLQGIEVIGINDGFEWLMQGDIEHITPLTIESVSRIHFRGGSRIGTSRASLLVNPSSIDVVLESLRRLGITHLITIGGDGTAAAASKLMLRSSGTLQVAHVPKTIDNDLSLPEYVDTFGYQSARHHGVEIVKNLMVDAKTTGRWYVVVAMGRSAGHLALGIGKASGATVTIIPEEFGGQQIRLRTLTDTIAGAIIKRLIYGRRDGVAVLAEGLVLGVDPSDLGDLSDVQHDSQGNVRIAEVNIGDRLQAALVARLQEFEISTTVVAKNIGYELRSADPIPSDIEYTRDLGFCAASYILAGGSGAVITMQGGKFVPVPINMMIDEATGRAKVRLVDLESARYRIARRYMIRLNSEDLRNLGNLSNLAAIAKCSPDNFRSQFGHVVTEEPHPLETDQAG